MRKDITIVGVGSRVSGVKNGRSYDFTPISFLFDDDYVTGQRAETVNVSSDNLCGYKPFVGDTVPAVIHQQNFRFYVDAILL